MVSATQALTDAMHKLARACTDPLWLQDRFLQTGHHEGNPNGTATFITFERSTYYLTCEHVVSAAKTNQVPELWLDRVALNIADYHPDRVYRHNFRFPEASVVDIAMYRLTEFHWGLLQNKKGKVAINLDAWREPTWEADATFIAAGYPTGHKTATSDDKVAAPMPLFVSDLASEISADKPTFALHSALANPHGWTLSGLSGGPVFRVEDENTLLPVGLVFEGGPSTEAGETQFATANQIFIRATTRSPKTFDGWLRKANYKT
jgi:hypothetical protein